MRGRKGGQRIPGGSVALGSIRGITLRTSQGLGFRGGGLGVSSLGGLRGVGCRGLRFIIHIGSIVAVLSGICVMIAGNLICDSKPKQS